jgi:ribosome biogenesis GTPase A
MKRIFLIDCPGVVVNSVGDTEEDSVLKGVVRAERPPDPTRERKEEITFKNHQHFDLITFYSTSRLIRHRREQWAGRLYYF